MITRYVPIVSAVVPDLEMMLNIVLKSMPWAAKASCCDYLLTPADFGSEASLAPEVLTIKADHIAAVVFTSGSTGKSKPNIKSWGSLHTEALLAIERFSINSDSISAIVATVPPQHMYGLETSIIVPMLSGFAIVCAPTFYPADIESAIDSVPGMSVLITTPIHLKACVNSSVAWKNIKFVISATAMMPKIGRAHV